MTRIIIAVSVIFLWANLATATDKNDLYFRQKLSEYFQDYYRSVSENNISLSKEKLISEIKYLLVSYGLPKEEIRGVDKLQDIEESINKVLKKDNHTVVLFVIPESEIINCWLGELKEETARTEKIFGKEINFNVLALDNLKIRDFLYFYSQGKEMLDAGTKNDCIYYNLEAMRRQAGDIWGFFRDRETASHRNRYDPSKLDRLRKHIKRKSWQIIYSDACGRNRDLVRAQDDFIASAVEKIKANSLAHELAHLFANGNQGLTLDTAKEEEFSFLFEMSNGTMPLDSLDTVVGIYAKGLKDIYYVAVENILNCFLDYIRQQQLADNSEYKGIDIRGNYLKDKLQYVYNLSEKQVREISGSLLVKFMDRF